MMVKPNLKLTKTQRNKLYEFAPGVGSIVFNSGKNQFTCIDFYTDLQGRLRRLHDGSLIFKDGRFNE